MANQGPKSRTIVVVGGGISGITAAVKAAEFGSDVILIERGPVIGGRVAQLNRYFPKLCPRPAASRSTSSASGRTRASSS